MNSFKSSPLIEDTAKTHYNRKSRRVSRNRVSKEQDFLVANPFRQGEQENFLPNDLKNQIESMDYISTQQIHSMSFGSAAGARRSSLFAKHLQAMQNAAKKQEDMYQFFMGWKGNKKESSETEAMEEEQPMTIQDNDNLSTRMNHCFLMMDQPVEQEQLNFLEPEREPEEDIIFYSQSLLPSDYHEDFEVYFDV